MADGGAPLSTAGHGGVDLISDLNDDVLREIITRLPLMEAARTAVLASRWRYLWRSDRLVLKDVDIHEPARDAVVPRVLADYPGHFRTVILADCRLASLDRELPAWPRLLVDKRTEKLLLAYRWVMDQPNPARLLPADILRCDSLQELTLDFWTFPSGTEVLLPRLRALAIVRIVISEQELECLIAASPVLESLRLTVNSSKHVRLRSKSLMCALVGLLKVEELTVVDTPLLARLFLFLSLPLNGVRIRIVCAPNLRVLGYLNTGTHELQIGDSVIRVKMLASFLRCFPNVDTLHIQSVLRGPSVTANEPSGDHHANFWREISPICCLRSHVKKMVIHNFRGDQNEFEFLKFVAMNAEELQSLLVASHKDILSSAVKVNETKDELQRLQFPTGISAVLRVSHKAATVWRLGKACILTIDDPFEC